MVKEPRISLNSFCEFLSASPVRKWSIVKSYKYGDGYACIRYKQADEALARFFNRGQDMVFLDSEIQRMVQYTTLVKSDFTKSSINALVNFKEMAPLELGDVTFHQVPRNAQHYIVMDELKISIRPDVLLSKKNGKNLHTGAVKFHLPQKPKFTNEVCQSVAFLTWKYLNENPLLEGTPHPKMCISVDVPSKHQEAAPTRYTMLEKYVSATCREYVALWDKA